MAHAFKILGQDVIYFPSADGSGGGPLAYRPPPQDRRAMIEPRDVDAIAKSLDPLAFDRPLGRYGYPSMLPRMREDPVASPQHRLERRREARKVARIAIEVLQERGWQEGPGWRR